MEFVGREKELSELEKSYARGGSAIMVYGRRRIGKTTLLERFCEGKRNLFLRCLRDSDSANLEYFSDIISSFTGTTVRLSSFIDFMKELKVLERQKKQDVAAEQSKAKFSADEVWNVLEFVFFPIAREFNKSIDQTADIFKFCQTQSFCQISKTKDWIGGLGLGKVFRNTDNSQIIDFVNHAKSMWYNCELMNPRHPRAVDFEIKRQFYISFFDDHYFVDGILNKNFPYGTYPTEEEKGEIISQFKQSILAELKDKL